MLIGGGGVLGWVSINGSIFILCMWLCAYVCVYVYTCRLYVCAHVCVCHVTVYGESTHCTARNTQIALDWTANEIIWKNKKNTVCKNV